MDGLLVVDKPAGPTSHDVVARLRRTLGERRIGHAGTLDPAATGVLCLVLGKATRLAQFLSSSDKTYEAVVRFGFATDSGDAQGRPVGEPAGGAMPSRAAVEAALSDFRGTYLQQPPAFSAKKIEGTRSHALARAARRGGGAADAAGPPLPEPVQVTAHAIDLLDAAADTVTLRVVCSAGFYVRALAHDLGARLAVGGHLASLRRTRSGDFSIDQAAPLDTLERHPAQATAAIVSLPDILPGFPAFRLSPAGVRRAINGCELGPLDGLEHDFPGAAPGAMVRLLDPAGGLVGVGRASPRGGALHPFVVLM